MLGAVLSSSGAGLSVPLCSDGIGQVIPGVSIADVGQSGDTPITLTSVLMPPSGSPALSWRASASSLPGASRFGPCWSAAAVLAFVQSGDLFH